MAPTAVVVARERGRHLLSQAPVVDGAVAIEIGALEAGAVIDLSLRTGPDEQSGEQRLVFAMIDVVQRAPYELYPTAHGSLSVRHAAAGGTGRPVGEKGAGPVVGSPIVRVLARLRRRGT